MTCYLCSSIKRCALPPSKPSSTSSFSPIARHSFKARSQCNDWPVGAKQYLPLEQIIHEPPNDFPTGAGFADVAGGETAEL